MTDMMSEPEQKRAKKSVGTKPMPPSLMTERGKPPSKYNAYDAEKDKYIGVVFVHSDEDCPIELGKITETAMRALGVGFVHIEVTTSEKPISMDQDVQIHREKGVLPRGYRVA
jgi:hypothetical protein